MKEIGGYFELECKKNHLLHEDGIFLNSGRNALRYILRAYKVKQLYVPYFTCPTVWKAIRAEDCRAQFYEIGKDLKPKEKFPKDAFVLYTNYWGIGGALVRELAAEYPNLIVDNAQALYAPPYGLASFYSPRKFFGLPDGGIAVCEESVELSDERDFSFSRMTHLLKRLDTGSASAAYSDFQNDASTLKNAPILKMSRLTEALMGNLDVETAKRKRLENVQTLHSVFCSPFIEHMATDDVPLVYPLYTENAAELRQKLIANKTYVASYWPGIEKNTEFRDHVLALPIDQRYGAGEMKCILEIVKE